MLSSRNRYLIGTGLLLAATLLAYVHALRGALLWDDTGHVTAPALQSLHGLRRIWLELGATQQYYPVLHSAFWFEHRLWGDATLGYHVLNVLLHAFAALLVVAIVRKLALPGAWLAGFIFALHPVAVESVAWISEQKNTLSGVFYLSAALVFLAYHERRQSSAATTAATRGRYVAATILFILALLTKSVTATLPAALLVVLWWRHGRLGWRRDVLPLLPWLCAGVAAGLFTAWVERTYIGAEGREFSLSFMGRCLIAGRVIWFYLGRLIWPANLSFVYPRWSIDPADPMQYLGLVASVTALIGLALYRRSCRGAIAATLVFVGTLVPVLGFLNVYPFRYSFVADHFQYLASLAVIIPFASWFASVARRNIAVRPIWLAAGWAIPVAFALLSFGQARWYRNNETLYRATLARNPGSWMPAEELGNLLAQDPARLEEVIGLYQVALRTTPDPASVYYNLANALSPFPERRDEAIADYRRALALRPTSAQIHENLANLLLTAPGGVAEAIEQYREALRLRPDSARTHFNLGHALMGSPNLTDEAIAELKTAVRLDPDNAEAHNELGAALARQPAHLSEAMAEYDRALQLNPALAEAYYNRGLAIVRNHGPVSTAVADFERALQYKPDVAVTHFNLAVALMNMPGRTADALDHFAAALRLNPNFAEAHYAMGVILASQPSHRAEALMHFENTLRLDPKFTPAQQWANRLRAESTTP